MDFHESASYYGPVAVPMVDNKYFTGIPAAVQHKPSGLNNLDGLEFSGDNVLCRVCGDRASGFHYGVHACEGCKGFFRRSIQQKLQYRPCLRNNSCEVVRSNRNRCQYCSFIYYSDSPANDSAVRFGRVPKKEKAKIREQMMLQSTQLKPLVPLKSPPYDPYNNSDGSVGVGGCGAVATADTSSHNAAAAFSANSAPSKLYDYKDDSLSASIIEGHRRTRHFTRETFRDFYESVMNEKRFVDDNTAKVCPLNVNTTTSGQDNVSFCEAVIQNVLLFAKEIPGFQTLDATDQVSLLQSSTFEVIMLDLSCLFDNYSNTMLFINGMLYRRPIQVEDVASVKSLLDTIFEFSRRLNEFELSDEEVALLAAIVLISNNRKVKLKHQDKVQSMYMNIVVNLSDRIRCFHPKSPHLFSDLMALLPDLHCLNILHSEKLIGTPDVSVKTEMEVCPLEVTDKDVRLSDVTLPGCRVSDDGVPISEIPDLRMPDDRILDVRIPDVRVSDTMLSDDRVPDVRVIDMSDMVAVLPDYTVANRYSPVSGHAPNHTPKHVLKPVPFSNSSSEYDMRPRSQSFTSRKMTNRRVYKRLSIQHPYGINPEHVPLNLTSPHSSLMSSPNASHCGSCGSLAPSEDVRALDLTDVAASLTNAQTDSFDERQRCSPYSQYMANDLESRPRSQSFGSRPLHAAYRRICKQSQQAPPPHLPSSPETLGSISSKSVSDVSLATLRNALSNPPLVNQHLWFMDNNKSPQSCPVQSHVSPVETAQTPVYDQPSSYKITLDLLSQNHLVNHSNQIVEPNQDQQRYTGAYDRPRSQSVGSRQNLMSRISGGKEVLRKLLVNSENKHNIHKIISPESNNLGLNSQESQKYLHSLSLAYPRSGSFSGKLSQLQEPL